MNLASLRLSRLLLKSVSALLLWLASAAMSAAWADPPGRVGRLADITGSVWLYSPDAGEWITATRNRPLTTGDRLSTDAEARVELRIGSTVLRLDSGTELEILRLDDERMAFQLHGGAAFARLSDRESVGEFELRTEEGTATLRRTGRYRFDRLDGTSHVTVDSGEAQIQMPSSATTVLSGQRAEFWLDGGNAGQYSLTEPRQDDFAAWNSEQDRRDGRSASARYVSPEMTGVEDLDRHGRWQQVPEYGALWVPRTVPQGWSPYGFGHWAWITPWGWTWVDDAPWGFAPFHYGRWVQHQGHWAWAPGTYVRRPVYAPALVAWVGGPSLSLSISIGGSPAPTVGWFPLAPREVYVPGYRVSPRYVREVNITHVTNITNVTTIINNPQTVVNQTRYVHRSRPDAVVVAPQSVLVGRQPVAPFVSRWRNSEGGRVALTELTQAPLGNALVAPAPSPSRAVEPRREGSPAAAEIPPSPRSLPWRRPAERAVTAPGQPATAAPPAVLRGRESGDSRRNTAPERIAAPASPVVPAAQATPSAPVVPAATAVPAVPATAAMPAVPATAVAPAVPATTAMPAASVPPAAAAVADRPDRVTRPDAPDRADRAARTPPITGGLALPVPTPSPGVPAAAAPAAPTEARRGPGGLTRPGTEPNPASARGSRGLPADDSREASPRPALRQRPAETRAEPSTARESTQPPAARAAEPPLTRPGAASLTSRGASPEKIPAKVPEKAPEKAAEKAPEKAATRTKPPRDEAASKDERR